jgi:hypothetical protein
MKNTTQINGMNIQEKELVLPSLLAFEKGKNEVASL